MITCLNQMDYVREVKSCRTKDIKKEDAKPTNLS